MARVRRNPQRRPTAVGAFIVRRAEAAKRADPSRTYKEIAREFGINERTLRKLRTGETSGRTTFRKGTARPVTRTTPAGGPPQLLTVHYQWWPVLADGSEGFRRWATTNVVVATQLRGGRPRTPFTAFDVFALADDPRIHDAVNRDIVRKMASAARVAEGSSPLPGTSYDYRIDRVRRAASQRAAPVEIIGRLVR